MLPISLEATANQSFTIVEDGHIYRIHIFDLDGVTMCCDINIDGVDVFLGGRCIHGDFLIPWPSLEQGGGNFMFFDDQGVDPRWQNFGTTSRLFYVTKAELGR